MTRQGQTICFLLGKRPREGTIFPGLLAELAMRGLATEVVFPNEANGIGALLRPALAVQRGLGMAMMHDLAQLETEGWQFCNPVAASRAAQDRGHAIRVLRAAGLSVPASILLHDWPTGAETGGHGAVVKVADGRVGRGAGIAFIAPGDWPLEPPFPGPWIVEERIASDGTDRKLYVAGRACRGLLKPWPRDTATAQPFDPEADLVHAAQAAGRALGLEIFGVDAVIGPDGPVIVDVNVFPGFRGVEGAATLIADHLCERLAEHRD